MKGQSSFRVAAVRSNSQSSLSQSSTSPSVPGSPPATQTQTHTSRPSVYPAVVLPCSVPVDQCPLATEACGSADCSGWTSHHSGVTNVLLDGSSSAACDDDCTNPECFEGSTNPCAGCGDNTLSWLSGCSDHCGFPGNFNMQTDCSQCTDTQVTEAGGLAHSYTLPTTFHLPSGVPFGSAYSANLLNSAVQHHFIPAPVPNLSPFYPFASASSVFPFHRSTPLDPSPTSQLSITSSSSSIAPSPHFSSASAPPPANRSKSFCLWGACREAFDSHQELVRHVNDAHLGALAEPPTEVFYPRTSMARSTAALACHWQDCDPKTSSSALHDSEFETLSGLANHLLQDHLGFPSDPDVEMLLTDLEGQSMDIPEIEVEEEGADDALQPPPAEVQSDILSSTVGPTSSGFSVSPPSHGTPAYLPPSHGNSTVSPSHVPEPFSLPRCGWEGCEEDPFPTVDALSQHIIDTHVGSGKTSYECQWQGCDRHGDRSFTSKQKILRHLQSHTGHRPFECTICGQHFSEAATLQQHQRRHTSEKPYKCDHPGCGKTFAVAGALTIHKRIHSGIKPFKCKYCERAFAESSNLSKHLRTHTGIKPYECLEPGCGKAFCRPDQLNRHKSVHSRKSAILGASKSAAEKVEV